MTDTCNYYHNNLCIPNNPESKNSCTGIYIYHHHQIFPLSPSSNWYALCVCVCVCCPLHQGDMPCVCVFAINLTPTHPRLIMENVNQTNSIISIYIHINFKYFIFSIGSSFLPSMVQETIPSSQNSFQSKTYYCHWSYYPLSYIIHN